VIGPAAQRRFPAVVESCGGCVDIEDSTPAASAGPRLITGATGRVAGVIARELALAHDVVAGARFRAPSARARLAALGVECVTGDLAGDLSALPRDVDILLNFAVSFSGDWGEALAVNAEGLGHLVDHLPRLERMLHCSSMGVYASRVEPHLESDVLGDSNAALMPTYSISKITGESMARYLARSRGIPTTIARLATPYGGHGGLPWDHLQAILADPARCRGRPRGGGQLGRPMSGRRRGVVPRARPSGRA